MATAEAGPGPAAGEAVEPRQAGGAGAALQGPSPGWGSAGGSGAPVLRRCRDLPHTPRVSPEDSLPRCVSLLPFPLPSTVCLSVCPAIP